MNNNNFDTNNSSKHSNHKNIDQFYISAKPFGRLFVGFIVATLLFAIPALVGAQTTFILNATTGDDDLRGGNTASLGFVLTDGTEVPAQIFSRGIGGRRRTGAVTVTFPLSIDIPRIRSIKIRHDGSPRPGNPFDTYDNWDLRGLSLTHDGITVYDSQRDLRFFSGSFIRFTGDLRQVDLPIRAISGEPDFSIYSIEVNTRGFVVAISNFGFASGVVSRISCRSTQFSRNGSNRPFVVEPRVTIGRGGRTTINVPVTAVPTMGSVICSVAGTTLSGMPEMVTANNIESLPLS